MRKKRVLYNTGAALLEELVAVLCGFILPRLILLYYGSAYNGLISSITQFIGCVALLKSGITGVSRAALYKPLADQNNHDISGVIKATRQFMKQVAAIFVVGMLAYACIYPFFVAEDFDWFFASSMVIILCINTFMQYYFGITYHILLQADQRQYVSSLINACLTILNAIVSVILIINGCGIRFVRLVSASVFCLNPVIVNIYVKKHYRIDPTVKPNKQAISQKWDAMGIQIANFIHNNTDLLVLTVLSNVKEISVYTVYYLVLNGIKKIVIRICRGVEAVLGDLMARKLQTALQNVFNAFEFLVLYASSAVFVCTGALIVPFVLIYTHNVTDVNYCRPVFAWVVLLAEFFFCIRTPYQYLVQAAGRYKETKNGAYIEAGINIVLSIVLTRYLGIIGVGLGTLAAMIFRTIQYAIFSAGIIENRKKTAFCRNFLVVLIPSAITLVTIWGINSLIGCYNLWEWIVCGVVDIVVAACFYGIAAFIFNKKEVLYLWNIFKKRGKKHESV